MTYSEDILDQPYLTRGEVVTILQNHSIRPNWDGLVLEFDNEVKPSDGPDEPDGVIAGTYDPEEVMVWLGY